MQSVEGLPVVGSMLGGMLLLACALSLVFVPQRIRGGLAAMSVPVALGAAISWTGRMNLAALVLLGGNAVAALAWRSSLCRFQEGWLLADCQVDKSGAAQWEASKRIGWCVPSLVEARETLHRYFTYYGTAAGAAGVWIPPSSLADRIKLVSVLAGGIFIFVGIVTKLLESSNGFELGSDVLSSLVSLLVIFAIAIGETTSMSKQFDQMLGVNTGSWWQQHVERLSNSEHVAVDPISGGTVYEAEHLFLGAEPWQNFPVLLHRPMLHEHAYVVGRTGSGKTSMALMQLVIQLIRGNNDPQKKCWSQHSPMVIVDLKGDEVLFQTAKAEAEKRGQKFRFFNLEPRKASFFFNPFSGFRSANRSIPQLVQLVLDALSLFHGSGYGKGYYSQRSRFLLSEALRVLSGVNSFQDLYRRLEHLYKNKKQDFQDAFELLSVIESLTYYPQLITTQQQDDDEAADVIRMDRVLEDREVVYFWLPSAKESAAVSAVGKLVLFNLQTAAQDRQAEGKERRQAFLVIDECQKLAGENFQQILQQARSAGIGAILANQSLSDLKTEDWDLGPTIRTNTRVKIYFSMNEPEDLKMIEEFSGEEIQVYGEDDTESIRPRISAKELLALSDHPKRLLLQVSSGSGYTQFGGLPIPVETDWPIAKAIAEQRASMPWPSSPMPPKLAVSPVMPPSMPIASKVQSAPAQTDLASSAAPTSAVAGSPLPSSDATAKPSGPAPATVEKSKSVKKKTPIKPVRPANSPASQGAYSQKAKSLFDED